MPRSQTHFRQQANKTKKTAFAVLLNTAFTENEQAPYILSGICWYLLVTAKKEAEVSGTWSCISCGCRLLLRSGLYGEEPWFEHEQRTVTTSVLMQCAHLDPEVKAEARHRKLHSMIGGLDTPVTVRFRYCVWCGNRYQGEKRCVPCGTGIYSIEDADTQTR